MVGSASHFVSRNALERCTTVQPLYTRFADRICTSCSETTMRPNPNVGARTCRPPAQTAPPWPSPPAALCRPHLLSGLTDTSLANRDRTGQQRLGPARPGRLRREPRDRHEGARGAYLQPLRESDRRSRIHGRRRARISGAWVVGGVSPGAAPLPWGVVTRHYWPS